MPPPPVTRFSTVDPSAALDAAFTDRGTFTIEAASPEFRMSVRTAHLERIMLRRFDFRDAVVHSHRRPHVGIHMPVFGDALYQRDGLPDASSGVIAIAPDVSARAHYRGECGVLVATVKREELVHASRELTGSDAPLDLNRTLSDRDATGGVFARHALFVWNELIRGDLRHAPIAMAETERALLARMVAIVSSETSPATTAPTDRVARAQRFIDANLERPLRAAAIAEAAGVSGPTLAREFRRELGTSPVAYARARRLDGTHRDLTCAHRTKTSVAAVAARWGFTHLGEFAAAYARQFGERPSETLRR
jgi:AraC-like DNA-binding protein